MQTNETVEQLTLFGQDLWCGKTCPELSPVQTVRTSERSSKKPSELRTADYLFLDLRPGGGNLLGPCWEKNSPLLGAFWTLNTGASPKDAVESSLSRILQAEVPQRYYLSKTACLGILRRAQERGKELPAQLKAALEVQAGISREQPANLPIAFAANQRDEVRDLHDVAGALGAQPGMKQQTFVAGVVTKGNGDCFLSPEKHTALSQGGGQAGQGYPCVMTAGFCAGAGPSAGTIGYQEERAPTLKASASGNMMPSILCLNDQGGAQMHCTEDRTGTLRAQEHGHQPLVFTNHAQDSRFAGPVDVAQTVSATFGMGGGNTPLVSQGPEAFCIAGNIIDRQVKNGGNGLGCQADISYTLTATDHHAVFNRQRVDQFVEQDVASTESARQHKDATDLVCQPTYQQTVGTIGYTDHKGVNNQFVSEDKCIVERTCLIRRLTPLECERLQGFPDGWTDIATASDSARYKALGNSVAIPCVTFVLRGIAAVLRMVE